MDMECGNFIIGSALAAVQSGELDVADMQASLYRAALVQFRLGMYDPPQQVPWVCLICILHIHFKHSQT